MSQSLTKREINSLLIQIEMEPSPSGGRGKLHENKLEGSLVP